MKKLLIIFILISSNIYADSIPGWLELDLNANYYNNIIDNSTFLNTELDFKYGARFGYFKPYLIGNTKTYFQTSVYLDRNHPFRDLYTIGAGLRINNIFYIELGHTCSHFVNSNVNQEKLYNSFTKYKHNHIKIGLKFDID